jgi:hypothetical protein
LFCFCHTKCTPSVFYFLIHVLLYYVPRFLIIVNTSSSSKI